MARLFIVNFPINRWFSIVFSKRLPGRVCVAVFWGMDLNGIWNLGGASVLGNLSMIPSDLGSPKTRIASGSILGFRLNLDVLKLIVFWCFMFPLVNPRFDCFGSVGESGICFFLMALWMKQGDVALCWGGLRVGRLDLCHWDWRLSWHVMAMASGIVRCSVTTWPADFGGFEGFPWIFPCLNPWIPWWIHRSSLAWPFWASSPQQKMWPALQCFDMRYRRLNTHCIVHWFPIM